MQTRWTEVDRYIEARLVGDDSALAQALAHSAAQGLPPIAVSAAQGKMLHLLARSIGARRVLEVGTLGGYSTIWLARALPPDGHVVSLEIDPRHADVARANLAAAGLAERTEVITGRALDSLAALDGAPPFDLAFIDADKASNADYFRWALKLVRPGGMIVVDNVVRGGAVVDPQGDANVQGVRRLLDLIASLPGVEATAVQTVGDKGWDGFLLALAPAA